MTDRLFEVTATGILYVHPIKLRAAQQKVMMFNMPSKQLQISKTLPALRETLLLFFCRSRTRSCSRSIVPAQFVLMPLHPASHTPGPVRHTDFSQEISVGRVL